MKDFFEMIALFAGAFLIIVIAVAALCAPIALVGWFFLKIVEVICK